MIYFCDKAYCGYAAKQNSYFSHLGTTKKVCLCCGCYASS